ncbi:outer membrane beta-barrel protein [Telmatobacter bradus]|uniref:outer membrane beta-barrel protein n=1 Tax=Telmatobacter bradus TaxID=474953 RepID=UPI003B4323B7
MVGAHAQEVAQSTPTTIVHQANATREQSTNPEDLTPLFRENAVTHWLAGERVRAYGWVNGGYSEVSSNYGLLNVAPSPTRFGNEFLLNGAWIIFERPTDLKHRSWGFRADFYGGSDAALLRPMNSFGPQGKHMGTDFRQLYISAHLPGNRPWDLQIGRQNMPLGYETLMAPYRPLYSQTYFWINFQVTATAALATWHPTHTLDILAGPVTGYNTIFELRGRAPDYISRITYRPGNSTRTTLLGTVFTGPKPAPIATGHSDFWQTVLDIEARRRWSQRLQQTFQYDSSWATKDQGNKGRTSATHGVSSLAVLGLDRQMDINLRGEWFGDPQGVHTGTSGQFGETTLGLAYRPASWVTFRPEIRGDFASRPAFGPQGSTHLDRNQATAAIDVIFKFSAIR